MAAVNPLELNNELLPKSTKAFIFLTDGDASDEEVVNAILYLAKKKGWREGHLQTVQITYGINQLLAMTLEAVFPERM